MKAASVTAGTLKRPTRNAELEDIRQQGEHPEEVYVRCECGERLTYSATSGRLVQASMEGYIHDQHCLTCHSGKHNACGQCGRCLPASGMGAWGEKEVVRADRTYCSPACRQKAYRARRRPRQKGTA